MSTKQHHYVLVFDTKTNEWTLDSDCEEMRFSGRHNLGTRRLRYGRAVI